MQTYLTMPSATDIRTKCKYKKLQSKQLKFPSLKLFLSQFWQQRLFIAKIVIHLPTYFFT